MTKLKEEFNKNMQQYIEAWDKFPWDNPDAYTNWLCQTYYYCVHTTRLLALAGARFPVEKQKLHNRFLDHTEEEKNHERLVQMDLKHMGRSLSDAPEYAPTSSLYQTQYYWISHVNPLAMYGYILSLEGLAVNCCPKGAKLVDEFHPSRSNNFLRVHGEEDIDHVDKAFAHLSNITPEEEKMILHNMRNTTNFYTEMLKECERQAEQKFTVNFQERSA